MNDDEHGADVIWAKRRKRWLAICRCGFTVIGGLEDEAAVRDNLQLHLSRNRTTRSSWPSQPQNS